MKEKLTISLDLFSAPSAGCYGNINKMGSTTRTKSWRHCMVVYHAFHVLLASSSMSASSLRS